MRRLTQTTNALEHAGLGLATDLATLQVDRLPGARVPTWRAVIAAQFPNGSRAAFPVHLVAPTRPTDMDVALAVLHAVDDELKVQGVIRQYPPSGPPLATIRLTNRKGITNG